MATNKFKEGRRDIIKGYNKTNIDECKNDWQNEVKQKKRNFIIQASKMKREC